MKKILINKTKFFTKAQVFILIPLFFSCSLKYVENVNVEETVPEFIFEGTSISSFEDNKITYQISAKKLEQYKNSDETYAKDVSFLAYDEDEISTETLVS